MIYELTIKQPYYKNLFSFLNGFDISQSLKVLILIKFYKQVYRFYKNRATINSKKSKTLI